jgi:hypothetical protein
MSISEVRVSADTTKEVAAELTDLDPKDQLISFPHAFCQLNESGDEVECTCCDGDKSSGAGVCEF